MIEVGFNTGMGFMDVIFNKGRSTAGLETSPIFRKVYDEALGSICYRFPGGTHGNFYNRFNAGAGYNKILFTNVKSDETVYLNINTTLRDSIYKDYYGYSSDNNSSRSNVIYPFINTITENKKFESKSTYVINVVNHYRNYSGFNTKKDLLDSYTKLDSVLKYSDLKSNGFSSNFIVCVDQNLSGILTLIKNGVKISKIELGNENMSYMADGDDKQFVSSNYDTIIWNRTTNNTQKFALDIHAKLLAMYVRLIKELYSTNNIEMKDLKFGVPITSLFKNSGFKQWNDYWINKSVADYVGFQAYIIHTYASITKDPTITDSDSSKLKYDFDVMNSKIENEHFKSWVQRDLKSQIETYIPWSEVWITEWDFGWLIPKIGNTLLGAICYFDELISFMDIPQIKTCHYHAVLNSMDTNYVFTRFPAWHKTTYVDPILSDNSTLDGIRYSSNYYAHLILSPLINKEMVLQSTEKSDLYYKKTYKDINGGTWIYFSNKSGTEKTLSLTKDGITSYISGDNLYDSCGKTTFKKEEIVTIKRNFNKNIGKSLIVPKYSIGCIYIS
jgi:hypothetical protein